MFWSSALVKKYLKPYSFSRIDTKLEDKIIGNNCVLTLSFWCVCLLLYFTLEEPFLGVERATMGYCLSSSIDLITKKTGESKKNMQTKTQLY